MRPHLVLALALAACTTVRHGPPPQLASNATAAQRCAYDRGLALVPSTAVSQRSGGGGVTYAYGMPNWYAQPSVSPQQVITTSHDGFTFYRGGERLDLEEGLELLGGEALVDRYDTLLDPFSGGRAITWSRPTWILLMAGGLAMIFAGSYFVVTAETDLDTGTTDYGPALPLLAGSLLPLLGSIPFLLVDFGNQDDAAELSIREAIFVPDGAMARDVDVALQANAEVVARECGVP